MPEMNETYFFNSHPANKKRLEESIAEDKFMTEICKGDTSINLAEEQNQRLADSLCPYCGFDFNKASRKDGDVVMCPDCKKCAADITSKPFRLIFFSGVILENKHT